MTTGRINQVTILNRRRGEGTPPRREADVSVTKKVGQRRIAAQPRASEAPEEPRRRATDSIAPTEFPRG